MAGRGMNDNGRRGVNSSRQEALISSDSDLRSMRTILAKFPRKDLIDLWEDHSDFCEHLPDFDAQRRRAKIVSELYNVVVEYSLKTKSIEDLIAKFELLYVALNNEKRTWKAYKLNNPGRTFANRSAFESKLIQQLTHQKIACHTSTCLRLECIWLRLSLQRPRFSTSRNSVLFIQYIPFHSYIFISGTAAAKTMDSIVMALGKVFRCTSMDSFPLKSHHVGSLIHMINASEGHKVSDTRNQPVLLQRQLRKRPALEAPIPEIVNQDLEWQKKKRKYVEKVFGKYEPPKLDKVTLMTDTKPFGLSKKIKVEENIKTAIIFQGSDVLGGLSKFVEHGIVKKELPAYLEHVAVSGSDTVYVNS